MDSRIRGRSEPITLLAAGLRSPRRRMPLSRLRKLSLASGAVLFNVTAWAVPIPFESTGALGAVNTDNSAVVFFTDDGTYAVNGVLQNTTSNRRAVEIQRSLLPNLGNAGLQPTSGTVFVAAYDFTDFNLGSNASITVNGLSPLLLLASGNVSIAGSINLSGQPGGAGGKTGGGGGGAGGGSLGIFANGAISIAGSISANGGDGGASGALGGSGPAAGGIANAGGGGGGTGGTAVAGGAGGDGGTGVLIGLDTAWVKIGLRAGGGGGGGGGGYDGNPGNGASLGGGAGNPGVAGKCNAGASGGDGGGSTGVAATGGLGGLGNGTAGGNGAQTGFGASGSGGGGGGGGGAPAGGNGGRGGMGGHLGGGGGGGGGGGDVCSAGATPGKGGGAGPGGGGGDPGTPGGPGALVSNALNRAGGPGGGGHIVLGSRDELTAISGFIDVLGGQILEGIDVAVMGAGGVLSVCGELGSLSGSFNGMPIASAGNSNGFYSSSICPTQETFALLGGGGGGGAGGDGLGVPEAGVLSLLSIGVIGLWAVRRRSGTTVVR